MTLPLFHEECPGHGFMTENGDGDMNYCDGSCLGVTLITNEMYEKQFRSAFDMGS